MTVRFAKDGSEPHTDTSELPGWFSEQSTLNGLQSAEVQPWHIVMTYDQFDEDGDNVHSGIYEESWAGPRRFKRSYKSDNLNQTDYGSEKGLYRVGDQQWPDVAQLQVRAAVIDPFSQSASVAGFHGSTSTVDFSGYKLQCVVVKANEGISVPPEYCFEPTNFILRYKRATGWQQTVYNQIGQFQGRYLSHGVSVTQAGKPYLMIRIEKVELIEHVEDPDFVPPPTAIPVGERISGVRPELVRWDSLPAAPSRLRSQHFSVTVQVVVGKNGHVIEAHALSGPREAYKWCEHGVRQAVFVPFLVLGRPVEVETKMMCNQN
jgi:hypothetical protein